MIQFLQSTLDGLLIGGVLIVLSLGMSLAFGVMRIVDFAVGEWLMLGAFAALLLTGGLHWEPLLVTPIVFVLFFGLGYFFQPLLERVSGGKRAHANLMGLVLTFGLSQIIRGGALMGFGRDNHSLKTGLSDLTYFLGPLIVPGAKLVTFIAGFALTLAFLYLLYRTSVGLRIRMVAQDKTSATLLGVETGRINNLVYGLHVGLTAVAGVFIGMLFTFNPEVGARYALYTFFVVVLGGMGYLPGVIVAALGLGLVQSYVTAYLDPRYISLAAFAILYLVLVISPRGLLRRGLE
ncbi:MAG: branched-chain amino acid ABC transporter permease [Thermaceae bacterium]|nr:branched-chain amino acid ABC transporter permease [Thermaceae bacterium]